MEGEWKEDSTITVYNEIRVIRLARWSRLMKRTLIQFVCSAPLTTLTAERREGWKKKERERDRERKTEIERGGACECLGRALTRALSNMS